MQHNQPQTHDVHGRVQAEAKPDARGETGQRTGVEDVLRRSKLFVQRADSTSQIWGSGYRDHTGPEICKYISQSWKVMEFFYIRHEKSWKFKK